jgi:hypothetical protein
LIIEKFKKIWRIFEEYFVWAKLQGRLEVEVLVNNVKVLDTARFTNIEFTPPGSLGGSKEEVRR